MFPLLPGHCLTLGSPASSLSRGPPASPADRPPSYTIVAGSGVTGRGLALTPLIGSYTILASRREEPAPESAARDSGGHEGDVRVGDRHSQRTAGAGAGAPWSASGDRATAVQHSIRH